MEKEIKKIQKIFYFFTIFVTFQVSFTSNILYHQAAYFMAIYIKKSNRRYVLRFGRKNFLNASNEGDICLHQFFFTPKFLFFLHQFFLFFTPIFFYTKIFSFFTPKFLLILHQKFSFFIHQFLFLRPKIFLVLYQFLAPNFEI